MECDANFTQGKYKAVLFTFNLNRKSMFFINQLFVPSVVLALLQISVFFLPISSTDRAGYAITCVLAIFVVQTNFSDQLPVTSEPVHFVDFLTYQMFIGAGITAYTLIASRIAAQPTFKAKRRRCGSISFILAVDIVVFILAVGAEAAINFKFFFNVL